jgi:hypothetical protein
VTTPVRVPGLRGRLPVKPPGEKFAIKFVHEYATEPLPAPSYPIDVTGGIGDQDWLMLANGPDPTCTTYPGGLGDCGFAARVHYGMAKAACYGETETPESSDDLAAEYLAYDHGQDIGVNLADVLLFWYQSGRIKAFAPVDHTDPSAMDSAMEAFKGLYVGVNLTDDANDLFHQGQPWTVANGEQPDPSAGHCIVKVKADGQDLDGYVTWGALQPATREWSGACLEEAWIAVMSEEEAAKIDMAALLADINALGGTGGSPAPVAPPAPAPVPEPPPAPEPPPVPVDPQTLLERLAEAVRSCAASVEQDVSELLAFLASHGL